MEHDIGYASRMDTSGGGFNVRVVATTHDGARRACYAKSNARRRERASELAHWLAMAFEWSEVLGTWNAWY